MVAEENIDLQQNETSMLTEDTEGPSTQPVNIWTPQRDGKYYVPSLERFTRLVDTFWFQMDTFKY